MAVRYEGNLVPKITFRTRVRDDNLEGPNPFKWENKTTADYFDGKRVVLFSLPGAFTPTCSTYQLPGYENNYEKFRSFGIDEIYCMSVNDAFVMNAWAKDQGLKNVKAIPDGNGLFTESLGMLVSKFNLGFGKRSWRYAAVINNGVIEAWFEEPGYRQEADDDPYGVSSPETVLEYLQKTREQNNVITL